MTASTNPRTLTITIAATHEDSAIARALLRPFAADQPFTKHTLTRLEICLAEALSNVVRHSYRDMVGGEIEVTFRALPDRLVLEISDEGRPMPVSARESIHAGDPVRDPLGTPVPELPEGGFGIPILRTVLDDVLYRRDGERNVLTLTMYHAEARREALARGPGR